MQIINVVSQFTQHATKRWEARRAPVDCLCVHHSGTAATVTLETIARYHVRDKDLPGVQYHYVIGADGVIYQTQPDHLFVIHGNDWNTGLGVCLLGNFTTQHPTPAQIAAARWLLAEKRREYGDLPLVGHGEAPRASTECPGDTWLEWRGELEEQEGTAMAMSRKIGVHLIGPRRVALGQPTICKWIDPSPGDIASALAETGPGCLFVVRFYQNNEPLDDPEGRADEWVDRHQAKMLALRQVTGNIIFEGYNEVGDGSLPRHARFEIRRMQRMHAIGLRAGVGSWGVGLPHESRWNELDAMLAAMWPDDVVCFHEYWRDTADIENNWHVCRFWHHGIREHLGNRLLAVTESGRDTMFDVVPQGDAGWKKTCGPDEFIGDLRRVGQLYDAIPQFIGTTVFQSGAIDPTWNDYEVAEIWPRVVAEYSTSVIPPVTPPVTPPPVEPPITPPAAGPTDEAIRNAAWGAVGVPYNPSAAFPRYAREHGLGVPLTGEIDLGNTRLQGFSGGVVCAVIGDWGNVREVSW